MKPNFKTTLHADRLILLATTIMMGCDGIQWSVTFGPQLTPKGLHYTNHAFVNYI